MSTALLATPVLSAEAFLDDLPLDRGSPEPPSSQLVRSIQALALSETLQGGTKLPASRALAARLGLARNTVLGAGLRRIVAGGDRGGAGRSGPLEPTWNWTLRGTTEAASTDIL